GLDRSHSVLLALGGLSELSMNVGQTEQIQTEQIQSVGSSPFRDGPSIPPCEMEPGKVGTHR
ncbi:MAG: hypothetical protein ACRD2L_21385, partial [Terriglobia bacterium]